MKALVNVHVNAAKGDGISLAKQFNVRGLPTLVVVDAEGRELDRIVGYRPPEKFTPEIQRILKGEDTLPALRAKVAAAADDLTASMTLARKLAVAVPAEAVALLEKVIELAKGKDRAVEASAWVMLASAAQHAGDKDRARTAAERVIAEFADSDAAAADGMVVRHHLRSLSQALKRQGEAAGENPQALNEAAWACFEHGMNLKDAVVWARKAVEASKRDAAILDTLANLLFVTGKADEAVKIEEEAVEHAKGAMKAELSETLLKFQVTLALRKAQAASKPAAGGAPQNAAGTAEEEEAEEEEEGEEGDEDAE